MFSSEWRILAKRPEAQWHPDNDTSRLDEAARAGWLYFIAGIPRTKSPSMLQVSRASAQRLVSLCLAERLITFRLEHPIAACMELAARLRDLLSSCPLRGGADRSGGAALVRRHRRAGREHSGIDAAHRDACDRRLGHGRAVRAAVERVSPIDAQPPDRLAGRQYLRRRLGQLLRHRRAARRPDQGAPLSDAAAVSDVVGEPSATRCCGSSRSPRCGRVAAEADLRLVGIGQMDRHAQVHDRRLHLRARNCWK